MRVVVGPVSEQSSRSWLRHARQVLDELDSLAPGECYTSPEVLAVFDSYLTEWERVAAHDRPFLWEQDIATEKVEYHMHAFQKVAELLAHRRAVHGGPQAPEESRDFYLALLQGVLAALEAEGPASAAFAQHLGEFWPGQDNVIS